MAIPTHKYHDKQTERDRPCCIIDKSFGSHGHGSNPLKLPIEEYYRIEFCDEVGGTRLNVSFDDLEPILTVESSS